MGPEDLHHQPDDGSPQDTLTANPGVNYQCPGPTNWCSAPRPGPGVGFAVGQTGKWAILKNIESNWGEIKLKRPARSIFSTIDDILAIDWLNHNVVVGGARSGKVLLGDTRIQESETALRLWAHEGIQHVRVLNSQRIVVGSLNDKVCTFVVLVAAEQTLAALAL